MEFNRKYVYIIYGSVVAPPQKLLVQLISIILNVNVYVIISTNFILSCSPNLVNYQVLVESMDCQLAHIGLYATRDVSGDWLLSLLHIFVFL